MKPVDVGELQHQGRSHPARADSHPAGEHPLRRLASAATTLSGAGGGDSVELIAAAACDELGHLHPAIDVSLHAFSGEGRTVCLAEHRCDGATTPGGRALDANQARQAYQRAAGGPWLETAGLGVAHACSSAPVLPGSRTAAWVPLPTADQVLGVMQIRADAVNAEDRDAAVTAAMATAVEFVPLVSALLRPGLEQRNATQQRRAHLERVMQGSFAPVFQPIMDLEDRRVEGYEALTRFADGTPPELRLGEAATVGNLVPLEAALSRAALRESRALPEGAWISINVSPSLLFETATLLDIVSEHHGRGVVLEVTEHDRIDDYETIRRAAEALGAEIRLSVDDAGSGYSCLRHILVLRPAFIKLDSNWVRDIERDPARQALAARLSEFSKRIQCELIAEGVETESQLQMLLQLEVRVGQGFHLGRPTSVPSTWPPEL